MLNEYRLFGPPGTGKTTRLAKVSIPKAVKKYGSDGVVVTSFTKAAAKQIISKGLEVDDNCVGTLHSLCYRALGFPKLTAQDNFSEKWNTAYPRLRVFGSKLGSLDEGGVNERGDTDGDSLLYKMDIARAKMIPKEKWFQPVASFYNKWTAFKNLHAVMDFTDLIEEVVKQGIPPPGKAKVMFVDEAQDLTPLQLSLIRGWGENMDWIMLVGDDDQTIYSFTGASPDAFLQPEIPDDRKMVLDQSYRVPISVHNVAKTITNRIRYREAKEYKPRPENGAVRSIEETYSGPDEIIDDIEKQLKLKRTVMVLASCSYMIEPVRKALVENNMPFGNKYRSTRGDWNPLARGGESRTSARDLLFTFLSSGSDNKYWNVPQFVAWASHIGVGKNGLKRVVGKKVLTKLKEEIEKNSKGLNSTENVLSLALSDDAIEPALARDVDWLMTSLLQKRRKPLEYPIKLYKKFKTKDILEGHPPITIGTIHSVKGGESDVVYLYPDISAAAAREQANGDISEDSLFRLFYVGVTRAKHELVLMSPLMKRSGRGKQKLAYFVDI